MPVLMFMPFFLVFSLGFWLSNKNKSFVLQLLLLFFSELINNLILFRIFFRFILFFRSSGFSLSALCLHFDCFLHLLFFFQLSFGWFFFLYGFFLIFLHTIEFISVNGNLFFFPRDISCAFNPFLLFSNDLFFIQLFLYFFIHFIICDNTL